jgi:hypothetical protein
MCGPHSFNGPVWASRVPIFISWAKAPEIKASEYIKTHEKMTALFIITSCFFGFKICGSQGQLNLRTDSWQEIITDLVPARWRSSIILAPWFPVEQKPAPPVSAYDLLA